MQRVTRAEAARQLGVNKATITRWVQKHPALLDADGLVSVDELRAHRDAVIDPRLQTNAAAKKTSPAPAATAVSMNDHKTRRERAMADDAELDLAERLGVTLQRREVESAVAEAAELLKQTATQMIRDRAEILTKIEDVREMERALDELFREAMETGTAALTDAVAEREAADAA